MEPVVIKGVRGTPLRRLKMNLTQSHIIGAVSKNDRYANFHLGVTLGTYGIDNWIPDTFWNIYVSWMFGQVDYYRLPITVFEA